MSSHPRSLFRALAGALFCLLACRALPAAPDRTLVLVSIDGLPGDYLDNPAVGMPTLRKMMAGGARGSLACVFPTVTWPNHTSIVTGVMPVRHGVLGNAFFDRVKDASVTLIWDPALDKTAIVKAPTLYDVAHDAGLVTASIAWPATRNAPTLDWQMPCVLDFSLTTKYSTPALLEELRAKKIHYEFMEHWLSKDPPPAQNDQKGSITKRGLEGKVELDRLHTQVAAHILETKRPGLLLLHYELVDATQHGKGRDTPEGYEACAETDRRLGELLAAVERSGRLPQTTFLVVSDHGFRNYARSIRLNNLLLNAGLLTVQKRQIRDTQVALVSSGGSASLYIKDPSRRAAILAQLLPLLRETEGVGAVLLPADIRKLGQPAADSDPRIGPDIMLSAKDGYAFTASLGKTTGVITRVASTRGAHGHLPDDPKLKAVFVAWGAGIKPGVNAGDIRNLDIAPTAARLLGLPSIPGAEGRVLEEILK